MLCVSYLSETQGKENALVIPPFYFPDCLQGCYKCRLAAPCCVQDLPQLGIKPVPFCSGNVEC